MKKRILSGFAAMRVAAAIIVPLAYGAQGRETRAERSASTISQSADRAEARIAILKADLRLSSDQAQHWASLESALRDIVAKRATISANQFIASAWLLAVSAFRLLPAGAFLPGVLAC